MQELDTDIRGREDLYDALDRYALERRVEIDKRDLGADKGLIKSYVLETTDHDGEADIPAALAGTSLRPERLGDDNAFRLMRGERHFGYAEPLGGRYLALHTYVQNTDADRAVLRLVEGSADLDALWLAGDTFQQVLRQMIAPESPQRNVIMKFEYAPQFAGGQTLIDWATDDDERQWATSPDATGLDERVDADRRVASLMERARRLDRTLPRYQEIEPVWRAVKTMRIPGVEHGGYDLYSWGKMTYRAPSFRGGRGWLRDITTAYERVTRAIEELVWLRAEPAPGNAAFVLRGLPVVCQFGHPLPDATFRGFVENTFERGQSAFRFWGNPIPLGERKVHVYALDLHLWQPLYMELTPKQFVFILPEGTCGNTVHRLMTNLQRFVDPAVTMAIGDTDYATLVADAIAGGKVPGGR